MKKGKKVAVKQNLYGDYRPQDSNYLNKLDEKIEHFRKQNKKYESEFYFNAKNFALNTIEVKKTCGNEYEKFPKKLGSIIDDRDIDKLFQRFQNDTRAIAKELFTEEMSIEEIVAIAIEYVRVSSSNFNRFQSEDPQNPMSELAEKFAVGYNGVFSLYFGLANDTDRAQLMTRLINCGIDIRHSIAYAECVVDGYGNPVTQIIEFTSKPAVALSAYCGVVKSYGKNISQFGSMYQFMDFSEFLPQAKIKALKAFRKFHKPSDLLSKNSNLESACEEIAKKAVANMSPLTACNANVLAKSDDRVIKAQTLFELCCLDRNYEYELIPDLFENNLATLKVNFEQGKFKIFPNKILDDEGKLAPVLNYILNRGVVEQDITSDENLSDKFDSISRDAQSQAKRPLTSDDIKQVSASTVLDSLQVRFKPQETSDFLIDGTRFSITEAELKKSRTIDLSDLGEIKDIDYDKAEQERLELEKQLADNPTNGLISAQPVEKKKPRKKSFFDMLDEIEEKVQNSRTKKLQQKYQEYEMKGELNKNAENFSQIEEKTPKNIGNSSKNTQNNAKTAPQPHTYAENQTREQLDVQEVGRGNENEARESKTNVATKNNANAVYDEPSDNSVYNINNVNNINNEGNLQNGDDRAHKVETSPINEQTVREEQQSADDSKKPTEPAKQEKEYSTFQQNAENAPNDDYKDAIEEFINLFDDENDDIDYDLEGKEWEEKYAVDEPLDEKTSATEVDDKKLSVNNFEDEDTDDDMLFDDNSGETAEEGAPKQVTDANVNNTTEAYSNFMSSADILKGLNSRPKNVDNPQTYENKEKESRPQDVESIALNSGTPHFEADDELNAKDDMQKMERVNHENHYQDGKPLTTRPSAPHFVADSTPNQNLQTNATDARGASSPTNGQIQESFLPKDKVQATPSAQKPSLATAEKPSQANSTIIPRIPTRKPIKQPAPKIPKRKV